MEKQYNLLQRSSAEGKESILPGSPIISVAHFKFTASIVDDTHRHLKCITRVGNASITCYHPHDALPNGKAVKVGDKLQGRLYVWDDVFVDDEFTVKWINRDLDIMICDVPKKFQANWQSHRAIVPAGGSQAVLDVWVAGRRSGSDLLEISNGVLALENGQHSCSTDTGFSGTALLDPNAKVVAIHVRNMGGLVNCAVVLTKEVLQHLN